MLWHLAPQVMHRRQDRGLHGGCPAAAPGRRAGQSAHIPGAGHTKGESSPISCSPSRHHAEEHTCKRLSKPLEGHRLLYFLLTWASCMQVWADLYGLPVAGCDGKTAAQIFEAAGCTTPAAPSCAACLGGPKDTFARMNEPQVCVSTTNRYI
jgi:hypothetical protein